MSRTQRLFMNLFDGWFQLRRRFPKSLLDEMTTAIAQGEREHRGEVCFAIESRLAPGAVLAGMNAEHRARQVFAQLHVWDTLHNSGVLFYVLMAEHRVVIIADRGVAAAVTQTEWDAIRDHMLASFARGEWRKGCLEGIAEAHALLLKHFPGNDKDAPDELPDRPVLL
ncbi:TLP18.3, Psb32 and MOLO-1 founding protein of phosphatase [Dyella jiangningensis]|uniref:TPM domain-containing protein n=1 Tax=Dyella sp. AtDHG13 TaxID=1938897 RepID=UPI00087E1A4E|nr:TPM domain-containing protein [Dyella sp. AtDHG13]PXV58188.1 TLP18.3/Psb32/MOLO-1 phosphatase superfamily protein [Dyella sp. AtDHG13]SDK12606.1 TLP18.3, Psb32 and MOLO-1 founding protein of phosphatase [Dyella jiangningensis]